jgi:nitronate monooxygenase
MTAWQAGQMAIRTLFTELFEVTHPLVPAPMGGVSGGALAAAVSEAGGLGLLRGAPRQLDH